MGANLIKKNAKGYSYKYTDLSEINTLLAENGITYYQYIETVEGNDYIMTVPIKDDQELPPRRGCRVTQATLKGVNNPAQEQGSALTYARRYSLLMAFGLATIDDDAELLSRDKALDAPATDTEKKNFKAACEMFDLDYFKILESVGWQRGTICTKEMIGKATGELRKVSDAKHSKKG